MEADTSERGRFYTTPEGKVYPSITTVLGVLDKSFLDDWRERIGVDAANAITEHAADRGTDLHACLEAYVKNEEPIFPTDPKSKVKIMFQRMKRVIGKNCDNIIAQEVPLYSDVLEIAGRCDLICDYAKVLSIVDFKGSNKAKKVEWITGYKLQVTGYSLMFEERTGIKIDHVAILMCGENDFSCQVFLDTREKYIDQLKETIQKYKESKCETQL